MLPIQTILGYAAVCIQGHRALSLNNGLTCRQACLSAEYHMETVFITSMSGIVLTEDRDASKRACLNKQLGQQQEGLQLN